MNIFFIILIMHMYVCCSYIEFEKKIKSQN